MGVEFSNFKEANKQLKDDLWYDIHEKGNLMSRQNDTNYQKFPRVFRI